MQCIRCGKEMENTTGGNYHCPSCGHAINDLVYRPSNCDIPIPPNFGKQEGWICPVCGRGVAPFVDVCPCRQGAGVINVITTTNPEDISVDLTKYYTLINDGTVPEAKL
jgi:DNA-directed RNA polymerase subunit RPC12/RpoP